MGGGWTGAALAMLSITSRSSDGGDASLARMVVVGAAMGAVYGAVTAPARCRGLGRRRALAVAVAGPLAGSTYGALLWVGLAFLLMGNRAIPRELVLWTPLACVLGFTALGALWASKRGLDTHVRSSRA